MDNKIFTEILSLELSAARHHLDFLLFGEISEVSFFGSFHLSYIFIIIWGMVLPIYKVLSLVIRVFSKPLVTYTKQIHLKNDSTASNPYVRKAFINLGNWYNRMETYINRKFMKIQTQFAYKPLNDELAIEKGIEFFYQIIFYSIVIGLPLYQMIRASNQAKAKSIALDQKLKRIDEHLQQILNKEKQKKQAIVEVVQQNTVLEPSVKIVSQNNITIPPNMSNQFLTKFIQTQKIAPLNQIKVNMADNKTHIYRVYYMPPPQKLINQ